MEREQKVKESERERKREPREKKQMETKKYVNKQQTLSIPRTEGHNIKRN